MFHSPEQIFVCAYIICSYFIHNSQWITFPTLSCLVLCSFWARLQNSLLWLMVSSLSLYNQHLLFCCVLSILALMLLLLIALFCAAIRRYSVSSLIFHFLGLAVRVFANRPGDLGSIPGRVIPKTQKMVLDASLLNTQHYKVRIKGKVEQSRERSSALPYTLV